MFFFGKDQVEWNYPFCLRFDAMLHLLLQSSFWAFARYNSTVGLTVLLAWKVVLLFVRQVLLFIGVEPYLRMQVQILLGISSGMMSFDLNGISCLPTSKLWTTTLAQELWLFTGEKRSLQLNDSLLFFHNPIPSPFVSCLYSFISLHAVSLFL